jgi:hypothetical protein
MTLFVALAIPSELAAQHTRYKLLDLGTLGGPHSYGSVNGEGFQLLNNSGVVASFADLALPDPYAPFFCGNPDCFQAHAFQWKDGVMTDLGALPVNNNSAAGSINARGWITGQSQNGLIDPVSGFPESRAVLWKQDQVIDLGTLGGNESLGIYVNDSDQVIGFSTINSNPDPLGFGGAPTHTFIGCVANSTIQTGLSGFVLLGSLYSWGFQRFHTGLEWLQNPICNTSENRTFLRPGALRSSFRERQLQQKTRCEGSKSSKTPLTLLRSSHRAASAYSV